MYSTGSPRAPSPAIRALSTSNISYTLFPPNPIFVFPDLSPYFVATSLSPVPSLTTLNFTILGSSPSMLRTFSCVFAFESNFITK